ncbi:MAG TPA: hypothetical protein VHT91_17645 [Kofleriaceae bacterium]|nr:hypothetical protein [Kofleriaceae bacterium]
MSCWSRPATRRSCCSARCATPPASRCASSPLIATTPVALQEALPRRDADALVARIDAAGAGAVLKVRKR